MVDLSKIRLKKLFRSPLVIFVLVLFLWPLFWMAASAVTVAAYSAGLTNHLGATRGFFKSQKMSDFVTLPIDNINLSYSYGSKKFWVSKGVEIYLKYSAINYGKDAVTFVINDYNTSFKSSDEWKSVKVIDEGAGILRHRAERSGFYEVSIIPMRLVSATEDVNYTYAMSWGTTVPQ